MLFTLNDKTLASSPIQKKLQWMREKLIKKYKYFVIGMVYGMV